MEENISQSNTKTAKKLKVKSLIFAGLILAISSTYIALRPDSEDAFKKEAITEVTVNFKDPQSAQYRDVIVYKKDNVNTSVCGSVNAKNSFGAYQGFDRFIYTLRPKKSIYLESEVKAAGVGFETFWIFNCR